MNVPHNPRWQFLEDVFLSNAKRDSVTTRKGRRVFIPGISDEQRADFEEVFCKSLLEIATSYGNVFSEEAHLENIRTLMNRVSAACGPLLNEGHLVFGVAQKALNSYLKYLWCDGKIGMPPHCPFDSIIIGKLKTLRNECGQYWTKGTEADYLEWVAAAKVEAAAKKKSLAEWELEEWAFSYQRKAQAASAAL